MILTDLRSALLCTASLVALQICSPARADDADMRLRAIEKQIQNLQAELRHMKQDIKSRDQRLRTVEEKSLAQSAAQRSSAPAANVYGNYPQIPQGYALMETGPGTAPTLVEVEPPPSKALPPGSFRVGGVTVTLGGFIEAAGFWRSRNQVADIISSYNTGIPLPNSPRYGENELRFSERQSRVSAQASADPDPDTHLTAYGAFDFLAGAPTANSVESNSYSPRTRQLYLQYERTDLGLSFLAGQSWSLITMDKKGITGNQADYDIPLTIDAQYVVGFTWARQTQFRVSKSFLNDKLWLALSVENPQTNYGIGPSGAVPSTVGSVNDSNAGSGGLPSTTNYTTEVAPDVIGKVAYDFKVAHLEAYGMGRFLHDRITYPTDTASSKTVAGGAGGAAAYIHLIPKYLDLQGSFLAGTAVGRYGSAQLPDATIGPDGAPKPLSEYAALVGLIGHPVLNVDLYAYGGREEVDKSYFDAHSSKGVVPYGYGNPLYPNTSCDVVLGSSSDCVGNTSAVTQGTIGGWWKFLHSKEYGSVQLGLQYSYTHRQIFQGLGPTPKTDENMVFFSFRYYPFDDTASNAPPAY